MYRSTFHYISNHWQPSLQLRVRCLPTMCLGTFRTTKSWFAWSRAENRHPRPSCRWQKLCVQWQRNVGSQSWSWWITTCGPKSRFSGSNNVFVLHKPDHVHIHLFGSNCLLKTMTWEIVLKSNLDEAGDDGNQISLAYRYVVAPNVNVHCYKPKELGSDVDRKFCRGTQLGACWTGRFTHLPRCNHCDVVWEVSCCVNLGNPIWCL